MPSHLVEKNSICILPPAVFSFLRKQGLCVIVEMLSRAATRLCALSFFVLLSSSLFKQENLSSVEGKAHPTRGRTYKQGFDNVDSVFVINLESRSDRLHEINAVLGSLGISNQALVKAIPHSCGALGCSLSHAMAVAECIDSNARTCAILEDDFELVRSPEEAKAAIERFFRREPPTWEVLMLSANAVAPSSSSSMFSHLDVINEAQTSSGYIIHKRFAPTLLHIFLQAAYHLNEWNCSKGQFAHDVLWKRYQRSGKWFALKPVIGKQRASYSDIEKMLVDYKAKRR